MREPQRLRMEQELATARRALYRCLAVAESGAYHNIEDALHNLVADSAAVMDAVMRGDERPITRLSTPA